MNTIKTFAIVLAFIASAPVLAAEQESLIEWKQWDAAAFAEARRDNKLIILDLVAVWCHWCHVMDAETYRDKTVVDLLNNKYVAVQADHDLRPDLAERYREWGWPATIILDASGNELVKRAGYIPPEDMRQMLRDALEQPRVENTTLPAQLSSSPLLSKTLRASLQRSHANTYDAKLGGLKIGQKYIDRDSTEWDLILASKGDQQAEQRARKTLDAALQLFDPAFNGVYQYSTHGDWQHPHFEKIMRVQAAYMRLYAIAATQLKEPRYQAAAQTIEQYLNDFLRSADGAYYVSQDADLIPGQHSQDYFALNREQRLQRGLPRIDKHEYARENGWAIEALLRLYQATQKPQYLERAMQAVNWSLQQRQLWGGGYRHDKIDIAGPYLGDTLAMGQAFIALYEVTGEKIWLARAAQAASFMDKQFRNQAGGLVTAVDGGTPIAPVPQIDENISAARFALALAGHSGYLPHRQFAEHIMQYLATPEIADRRITEAGILIVDAAYQDLMASAQP